MAMTAPASGYVSEAPDRQRARPRGSRIAMRHKDLGIWQSWTWAQVLDEVRAFSVGLEELGLKRGDKFAIIGANRPRLYWAMCAGQALGAVPVPIYADSVADEMAYVLEHAEVTVAVVENQEQVDKVLSIADRVADACATWSMTSRAACATTTARKLSWIDDVQKVGREKLAPIRRGSRAGRPAVAQGQGRRPRGDPLHLGHDRAAEGRDAHLRQRASSRRATATSSTSSTRTRRRSPICRSPGSAITCSPTRSIMSRATASIARRRARPWWRTGARSAPPTRSRRRASTRTC